MYHFSEIQNVTTNQRETAMRETELEESNNNIFLQWQIHAMFPGMIYAYMLKNIVHKSG